jgi:valyl-tRNA synthetase
MLTTIAKAYEPRDVETRWYAAWIENRCFSGRPDPDKEPYCIVIPPPNVTGVLTMGHVLNNTLQDILIRRARQQGKAVLWQPGTDHAGIATQTRVERQLRQTEGKTRRDLGRDKFLEKVWEWKETHGGIIIDQLKKLGCSCDWEREVFTLDPEYSRAVQHSFVELFRRGYVYRGKRMVHWCPASLTALSDEEVIMKPQKGILYKMRYELVEHPGQFLEISTTRPETLMGDTAVAVHPEDDRYQHLIGQHVWRPFPRQKLIIVGDTYIDREFGTGVLKVTPAHDRNDFDIGQRHNLDVIDVFHPDGTLNDLAGPEFAGMDRFKAREKVAEKLRELDLMVAEEPYENNVGFSERADVPIEPRLSEQWFLKYPAVEEAKQVVGDGVIRFHPERWSKVYLHWLENIQDWCISRQLWWGHRIPVWYRKGSDRSDPTNWHVDLEAPADAENWEQEEDVLDTWASSWLWPFATMGWPDEQRQREQGLDYFYPTSSLVTGPDIIFFWVARMIMAGLEFMHPGEPVEKRIPFKDVYFTGIIRDIQGRKMSKSLGNSPDPLELIAKYGADGLRLGVILIAPQGQDIRFSEDRVETGRNFCNKLWNACRFRQMSGEAGDNSSLGAIIGRLDPTRLDNDDHAILQGLLDLVRDVNQALDSFEFNTAVQKIFSFFWSDLCDWYVEVSKAKLQEEKAKETCLALQDLVIRQVLLMLHPYCPFITEELWHSIAYGPAGQFIQDQRLEGTDELEQALLDHGVEVKKEAALEVAMLKELVTQARSLKAEYNLASKRDTSFFLSCSEEQAAIVRAGADKIKRLAGAKEIQLREAEETAPAVVTPLGTLYLDLASSVDVGAEKLRMNKELEQLDQQVRATEGRLSNKAFTSKAPDSVVAGARKQLESLRNKRDEVQRLLAGLSS